MFIFLLSNARSRYLSLLFCPIFPKVVTVVCHCVLFLHISCPVCTVFFLNYHSFCLSVVVGIAVAAFFVVTVVLTLFYVLVLFLRRAIFVCILLSFLFPHPSALLIAPPAPSSS